MSGAEISAKRVRDKDTAAKKRIRTDLAGLLVEWGAGVLFPHALFREELKFRIKDDDRYEPWDVRRADGGLMHDIAEIKRMLWEVHSTFMCNIHSIGYVILTPDRTAKYLMFEYLVDATMLLHWSACRVDKLSERSEYATSVGKDLASVSAHFKELRSKYECTARSSVSHAFTEDELRGYLARGLALDVVRPREAAAIESRITKRVAAMATARRAIDGHVKSA